MRAMWLVLAGCGAEPAPTDTGAPVGTTDTDPTTDTAPTGTTVPTGTGPLVVTGLLADAAGAFAAPPDGAPLRFALEPGLGHRVGLTADFTLTGTTCAAVSWALIAVVETADGPVDLDPTRINAAVVSTAGPHPLDYLAVPTLYGLCPHAGEPLTLTWQVTDLCDARVGEDVVTGVLAFEAGTCP